jgi:hypothetical protein
MNNLSRSDPAERSALIGWFTRTGAQRVLDVGSIGFGAGGQDSGCRQHSRPRSKFVVANPAAYVPTRW